jgi:hypothetical protein
MDNWIIGWGDTTGNNNFPDNLQNAKVQILATSSCSGYDNTDFNKQICAGIIFD